MVYKIGTVDEVNVLPTTFPKSLCLEIFDFITELDANYGKDRNYLKSGGYCLLITDYSDLAYIENILSYDTHLCEWTTRVKGTGNYLCSLFVYCDNFSIILFIPAKIAPENILNLLED